jgi:hypothetical protein
MENNSFVKKGLLNSISDSSIMVGSSPIQLNNLKLIGNISKGSGAAMILTSGLSGALFGFFVLGPSSTTVKSIGVISSFALFTYSIKIGSRNKMRNVKKKWSIRKN